MKIEECSYCGMLSLTENSVCENCRIITNEDVTETQNPAAQEHTVYRAENYRAAPQNNHYQPDQPIGNFPQRSWTEVKCWKCRATSIWEQTKICQSCGCYLRPYNEVENKTLGGDSFASSPVLRSLMVVGIGFVFCCVGFFYLMKGGVKEDAPKNIATDSLSANASLPPDSWYQPPFWKFYSSHPSVPEIIEKNNEVTSKTLKPGDLKTMSMTATLMIAQGENDDDYFNMKSYMTVGTVETSQKMPDKMLRKVRMIAHNNVRQTELTEAYNGLIGWKRTITYDSKRIYETDIKELVGSELDKLKNSSEMWRNKTNEKNLTFLRTAKLQTVSVFVLQDDSNPLNPQTLYFDAVSGYLIRMDSNEGICYMSSYKEFNGVSLPSEIYLKIKTPNNGTVWMGISGIAWQVNQPVEDSIFDKRLS